ncbi:hypothetical protein F2Q69_00048200 [Brassica cretica]|uniref:Uncharacterized protein n=1 Tax=Brassica cretica TaxID=69181 RepID=A0A8S9PNV1_BRACR|nr:hypothetical protein F2Q69_00048200 [Brassica cretica]
MDTRGKEKGMEKDSNPQEHTSKEEPRFMVAGGSKVHGCWKRDKAMEEAAGVFSLGLGSVVTCGTPRSREDSVSSV